MQAQTIGLINNPDANTGFYGSPIVYGSNLYFQYQNGSNIYQLAKYDGTSVTLIGNPDAGAILSGFQGDPIVYGSNLYLEYQTASTNYQLTTLLISPHNADLSALTTTAGTLSPTFVLATIAYTASVTNATTSITVTPTQSDATATIQVQLNSGNYSAATSGSASGALALNVGSNTINIKVTAQDGTTIKTYTITVTRACESITVTQPSNQTVSKNASTAAISFSGTGANNYNWVNNNTAIGLGASGTGNIASFTATNTTSSAITGTVTVTPSNIPYAYIAQSNNIVSVINTSTNAVVTTISVGASPVGTAVSPDGTKVYVSHYTSLNNLSVISTATNTVTATVTCGTNANGVAVSPDGSKVYVVNSSASSSVSVVNTTTNTVVATISIGSTAAGICVSPDGSKVYVANAGSGNVSVITTATNTVSATITVGTNPLGVAISPDGNTLYVSNHNAANLSVINTATNTVTATIAMGIQPLGIAISTDGSRGYIANYGSANMTVINTSTNAVVTTVSTGNNPFGVSVSPDGNYVYVPLSSTGSMKVFSTSSNTLTNTIAISAGSGAVGKFISGSGCTGTPVNFSITVNPAPPGNALNFDGVDDYVTGTSAVLPLGNSARTIEAWIKPGVVQNGSIFNWGGSGGANTRSGILYIGGYLFFVGQNNDLQGTIALPVGKWSHVAATFDGTTLKLYVNGIPDGSAAKTFNTTGTTFRLGVSSSSFNEYFNGSIDEVRIWNTALTQAQLQANMLNVVSASSTNLVAYYNFDNGTAGGTNTGLTTLTDQTSNANNGTLTNFALTGSTSNWVSSTAWNTWTGTTSNSFATATNWSLGTIPTTSDNIVVPTGASNLPVSITGTQAVNITSIQASASATVTGTLQIAAPIYNSGTLTATSGTIELNGTTTQTVATSTFASNTIQNLTINNAAGVTLGGALKITGTLNLSSGTLATGGFLTIAPGAAIPGAYANISGNVTLQQSVIGQRGWRVFANPFSTTQTLSSVASTNGIAINTTAQASGLTDARTFASNAWVNNTSGTIASNQEYALFIRGLTTDATGASYSAGPTAFTYNISGALNTNRNIAPANITDFIIVGNPYAAPVKTLALTGPSGGGSGRPYYTYQIAQGGTQTAQQTKAGSWVAAGTNSNTTNTIPVLGVLAYQPSVATAYSITTTDINTSGTLQTGLFGVNDNKQLELLVEKDGDFQDKLFVRLDAAATAASTNNSDLQKLYNDNVNVYTINKADNQRLAIDARKELMSEMPMGISALAGNYNFKVAGNNLPVGSIVMLEDRLLKTQTELKEGTVYPFTISSDTASRGENRFVLNFSQKATAVIADVVATFTAKVLGNITHGNITVKIAGSTTPVTIKVVDVDGKTIKTVNAVNGINTINLGNAAAGFKLLQISNGQETIVIKAAP